MKKLIMFAVLVSFGFFACQSNKPPENVLDAFTGKFAAAEKVKWEQEEENEWEAEFIMGGKEMSACFDNSGNWFETEGEIEIGELLPAILDSIDMKFEGYEIEEAASIETIEFSGFEIIIAKGDEKWELLINAEGEISSMTEIEVSDNDEDNDADNNEDEDEDEDDDEGEDND